MTFNSYRRENSAENRYLYNQGTGDKKFLTERVFDLGLNIDLSKYRAYDPAIARWWQVDPLADFGDLVSLTPYNYAFNNPILYSDPEGNIPIPFIWGIAKAITVLAEAGAFAAGGTAVAVGVTGLVENAPSGAHPAGAYSPGVGFAMSSSKPGEISSPYFLNSSKSKADGIPTGTKDGERAGKDFTPKGKKEVIDANKQQNEGKTVCEDCKTETTPAKKSERGVSPPKNETRVDHTYPKSQGGDGSPPNGRVLCDGCNNKKSDQLPEEYYKKKD